MTSLRFLAFPILMLAMVLPAMGAIRLGAPFGEHMVLQQGVPVSIWGAGAPGGDTVRISFAGQNVTAKSDWEGRWMAMLAPMKAGGPYQMLIEVGGLGPVVPSSAANSRGGAELNDVVVGEVRVVSRALPPAAQRPVYGTDSVPASSAWIRVFKAPVGASGEAARWSVVQPGGGGTLGDSSYAAAEALYKKLRVPIGLIERSRP